jgi:hypothetical protein
MMGVVFTLARAGNICGGVLPNVAFADHPERSSDRMRASISPTGGTVREHEETRQLPLPCPPPGQERMSAWRMSPR